MSFWDQLIADAFTRYPLRITIAIIVIAVSFVTSVSVYLVIVFSRLRDTRVNKKLREARELIADKLFNCVYFMEEVGQMTRDDLRRIVAELKTATIHKLDGRVASQVLIDQLIYLKRNFTSRTGLLLHTLYQGLELRAVSQKKLSAGSWEVQAQGIAELGEMTPAMRSSDILPYTKSLNADLRVEAQAAYIRLNTIAPFSFLDDTTEELVEWHQIILFDVVTRNEHLIIPSFSPWLGSSNPSVVVFCLKLIVHYVQLEAIPDLIRLLDHIDPRVQNRAIDALGKLEAREAEHPIIVRYPSLSVSCKIEALDTMGSIGSQTCLSFLRSEFLRSDNSALQMQAMCSIKKITADSKSGVLKEFGEIDQQRIAIINHCFDELISA